MCSKLKYDRSRSIWSPRGPTPDPFPYHFWEKWHPFRIPSTDKWYHFHIPSIENCIPFNCYKYNVFIKYQKITKPEQFLEFFAAIKSFSRSCLQFDFESGGNLKKKASLGILTKNYNNIRYATNLKKMKHSYPAWDPMLLLHRFRKFLFSSVS